MRRRGDRGPWAAHRRRRHTSWSSGQPLRMTLRRTSYGLVALAAGTYDVAQTALAHSSAR